MKKHFYQPSDLLYLLKYREAIPSLDLNWRSRYHPLKLTDTKKTIHVGYISTELFNERLSKETLFQESFTGNSFVLKKTDRLNDDLLRIAEKLKAEGYIRGWRNEKYPSRNLDESEYDEAGEPRFLVERAFAKSLGLLRRSVHVNGLTVERGKQKNDLLMWMGFRAKTKQRFPSLWDNLAAGGVPFGEPPTYCAVRELEEEASVPQTYSTKHLISAGLITRVSEEKTDDTKLACLSVEEIFVYDLNYNDFDPANKTYELLPPPKPKDDEVEIFKKMSIEECLENANKVKPDVLLVLTHLMLRYSLVDVDGQGYSNLIRCLNSPLPKQC